MFAWLTAEVIAFIMYETPQMSDPQPEEKYCYGKQVQKFFFLFFFF